MVKDEMSFPIGMEVAIAGRDKVCRKGYLLSVMLQSWEHEPAICFKVQGR